VKLEVVAPLSLDDTTSADRWRERLRAACADEMNRSAFPMAAGRVRVSVRAYLAPGRDVCLDQLAVGVVEALEGVAVERADLVIGLLVTRMALEPDGEERIDACVVLAGEEVAGRASRRRAA
jgi:hypothetical protein